MYLYGSFCNQKGDIITAHILTNRDRSRTLEIGTEEAGVYFTDDPGEIVSEANDTFDHLLRQSATIRLLCRNFMGDLFCASARDAVVNIYKGDTCIFAGFIEPQTYSQPYNEELDELEVNCIDALSALQYAKYKNIGAPGVLYAVVKSEAVQRSFRDIVLEIMDGVTAGLDIVGGKAARYLYDRSKAVDSGQAEDRSSHIFDRLAVSELLFLGDEEDDAWEQETVLEEILRYLNLHVMQQGFDFFFYDWETVTAEGDSIEWMDMRAHGLVSTARGTVDITTDIVEDCDTQVSIGETYNQLILTCDIEGVENVIESPLDDDLLTSPYTRNGMYCREFSSQGKDELQRSVAFVNMIHDRPTTYGGASYTDWYVRIYDNTSWTFPMSGSTEKDLITEFGNGYLYQNNLPDWLSKNPGAAILGMGKVQVSMANTDNKPLSKIDMTKYFAVSINGNGSDEEGKAYPDEATILANIPYARYKGSNPAAVFSPADEDTTNYIVFSGKVVLTPLMPYTYTYKNLRLNYKPEDYSYAIINTVPARSGSRLYTRQYFLSSENPTWHMTEDYGFIPYSDECPQQYEFQYSAVGDGTDQLSKVAFLACMLIIGDKCLVEKQPGETLGTDTPGTGNGQVGDFVWMPYKTREQCSDDDEYYGQSFTLGFDPKIGDKIIGTEFDFQNNVSFEMNIDAEGIAVPIRKADKLAGDIQFLVLGPVNTTWDVVTRRHKTWFRKTKWGSSTVPLLAHVSSIMMADFEVKVYSDSGLFDNAQDDKDVIYMSDEKPSFINKKDDIDFKICSALTSEECKALGVSNGVKLSAPVNTQTGDGLLTIYDANKGEQAKPEQFYVDSYYREYSQPRLMMEQNVRDTGGTLNPFGFYRHPALGKTFYVTGFGRNLIEGSAQLNLKELWH